MEIVTNLDQSLVERATKLTGEDEVSRLLEAGLEALIERESANSPAAAKLEPREMSMMDTGSLARIVARDEFFAQLDSDEINQMLEQSAQRAFTPGESLIRKGEDGDSMFILRKGYVEVWVGQNDDEEVAVAKLQPGEFFGEMSLLTGAPRTATIRALTSVVVEEVSKESFRGLLHKRPELLGILSRIIAERRLRLKLAQEDAKSEERGLTGQLMDRMRSFFGLQG
ncbi:MAG: cyclic nucleotide-binding domain-containing protein [Verrucomicrobiota bacterium]